SQSNYREAKPLLERSLAIWDKMLGPDHPHVAMALNNLAQVLQSQVRVDPLLYTTPLAITHLLATQGNYEEAKPLLERSLTIREKVGPDDPDVAMALKNLAGLLRRQSKYAEAGALYERATGILEKALGPDHPEVAAVLHSRALSLLNQ
ncbi:unnamed protein product, partial [Hapterophycus canaliculatus]